MRYEWEVHVNGKTHLIRYEVEDSLKKSELYIDEINKEISSEAFIKMIGIDYPFNIDNKEYRLVSTSRSFVDIVEDGFFKKRKTKYIPLKNLRSLRLTALIIEMIGIVSALKFIEIAMVLILVGFVMDHIVYRAIVKKYMS